MVIFRSKVEERGQRDRAQSAFKNASVFAIGIRILFRILLRVSLKVSFRVLFRGSFRVSFKVSFKGNGGDRLTRDTGAPISEVWNACRLHFQGVKRACTSKVRKSPHCEYLVWWSKPGGVRCRNLLLLTSKCFLVLDETLRNLRTRGIRGIRIRSRNPDIEPENPEESEESERPDPQKEIDEKKCSGLAKKIRHTVFKTERRNCERLRGYSPQ